MLLSFALILLLGGLAGRFMQKVRLPALLGMLFVGIALGPNVLNWLDSLTLDISADLRQIALIIILARAGLSLDLSILKRVGRPALRMAFVPACFEMVGVTLLAPILLGVSRLDAAIMGSVLAAVSPAVVVPHMLNVQNEGYGVKKGIPQLILTGASLDDVFVIVVFSVFVGMAQGSGISWMSFAMIPVQIGIGILVGLLVGYGFVLFFHRFDFTKTERSVILLAVSFILVTIENQTSLPFSGLIAVMASGLMIQRTDKTIADPLAHHYNQFWQVASIALFVLVGASVDLNYLIQAGLVTLAVIIGALAFRILGVWVSLIGTNFSGKEKLFCMIAYTPKATVQASIGGVPLALGLTSGNIILVVAILAIMTTAPIGAFLIENTYKHLLDPV